MFIVIGVILAIGVLFGLCMSALQVVKIFFYLVTSPPGLAMLAAVAVYAVAHTVPAGPAGGTYAYVASPRSSYVIEGP